MSGIFITNIETDTINNTNYRQVLFTAQNQQLVVQSVKPRDDIPYEIHPENDQFIRVEHGVGKLVIGPNKEYTYDLSDGTAVVIPAGTWHQIINVSDTDDLKLYTIYSPKHLPEKLIEVTKPVKEMHGGFKSRPNGFTKANPYKRYLR